MKLNLQKFRIYKDFEKKKRKIFSIDINKMFIKLIQN